MNDTIYWDNLEAKYAPLVCSPIGGDPDYAFVCWYILEFITSLFLLNSAAFFLGAYRKVKLDRVSGRRGGVSNRNDTNSTGMPDERTYNVLQRMMRADKDLSYIARLAIAFGVASLLQGLALILCGGGTSYTADTLRGQLGDGCCECTILKPVFRLPVCCTDYL
jgi:hypothetical protein